MGSIMQIISLLTESGMFIYNEYFYKYVNLVETRLSNVYERGKTNKHHIIPRIYFKHYKLVCDDSMDNVVVLTYKEHIIAHYYLVKCSKYKWFKLGNIWAVSYMCGIHKDISDEQLGIVLASLNDFRDYRNNPMHIDSIKQKHDTRMKTYEVKHEISCTIKRRIREGVLFNENHKAKLKLAVKHRKSSTGHNISKTGYVGGTTNLKRIFKPNGKITYVEPNIIQNLLDMGYSLTGKQSVKPNGFNRSNEFRQAQSKRLLNFYSNNPNYKTKSKKPIRIFNNTSEIVFNSVKEAEYGVGLSFNCVGRGRLKKFIDLGTITLRKSKYFGWQIEYYNKI